MPWVCSFENGLCGMFQRLDDDFGWTRNMGSTPSQDTGPEQAASGQYYIYTETSSPRRNGDAAV